MQANARATVTVRRLESKTYVKGVRRVSTRETILQWVHLVVRLCELAAAVWYIVASIQAAAHSLQVMRGYVDYTPITGPYSFSLLRHYVGDATLRTSPLVVDTLQNSTALRNGTIYLQSDNTTSTVDCGPSVAATFNAWTYSDAYLRKNWMDLVADTSYNLTFLADRDLIAPFVDCTSTAIMNGDNSAARVFYLLRKKADLDEVSVLTWSLSAQDYLLPIEVQVGAAASITLTHITDLSAASVEYFHVLRLGFPFQTNAFEPYRFQRADSEGLWVLESIPRDPTTVASKVVSTACRSGFYVKSLTEQCNIRSLNWRFGKTPIDAMETWDWFGYSLIRDSWAWVHTIHVVFAVDAIYNILVLLAIVYRNARNGKLWIGDAFVSISSTLLVRGVVILVTWIINDFWTLMEFCLSEGSLAAMVPPPTVFEEIIYADLLAIYLGLAGLLGHALRERIDPAFVVLLFHVGFQNRHGIAVALPQTTAIMTEFATADFFRALAPMEPKHEALTPMRLWTVHALPAKDSAFIVASLLPIFASFVFVILYVPIRKLYLHYYPPRRIVISSRTTGGASSGGESSVTFKRSLTVFEIATGAPLQNRVGLVSDYDNCVYIKGMKFASADGIYCNGFVIASGKWLVSTVDLPAILFMILTRVRFKNVYAYQVDGHTVQPTARLVYPQTMTLAELLELNISTLS